MGDERCGCQPMPRALGGASLHPEHTYAIVHLVPHHRPAACLDLAALACAAQPPSQPAQSSPWRWSASQVEKCGARSTAAQSSVNPMIDNRSFWLPAAAAAAAG
jgi:hypothetical protein